MSLTEDIKPISYLKANAAAVLHQLRKTHRPMIITQNSEAMGIIQDIESYEKTKAALGLLKLIAQGEKDIKMGKTIRQEELFSRIEDELGQS